MKLLHIELESFRNHRRTQIDTSYATNVFVGRNGEGKTNILEAVSFLCLTKSFYAGSDATVLCIGEPGFTVAGTLESDHGIQYGVRVTYDGASADKRMTVNGAAVERPAALIGDFPLVVLSPENSAITFGGPGDRRRFIDLVVAQSSRSYMEDLLEYRKVLRQRNRILADAKQTRTDCAALLEPWNSALASRGARITAKRRAFVEEVMPLVTARFTDVAGTGEIPGIRYDGCSGADGDESIGSVEQRMLNELARRYPDERRMGSTLVGPHRDELEFSINGLELRKFASQGQHKTFLVALKMAEFHYLRDRCKETPLLLLDDVFSELDDVRSRNLMQQAAAFGQVFITATDDRLLRRAEEVPFRRFTVQAGSVDHGETVG